MFTQFVRAAQVCGGCFGPLEAEQGEGYGWRMPGALAVELLVTLVAEGAMRLAIAGPIREWRLNAFFDGLPDEQKDAFLGAVCAAIVHDGVVTEAEEKWLDRRREASDGDADRVDGALRRTTAALPAGSTDKQYTAYVEDQAATLDSKKNREKTFQAVRLVLWSSNASKDTVSVFSGGLGISEQDASVIESHLMNGLK